MFGYPLPRWLLVIAFGMFALAALAGRALAQKTVTVADDGRVFKFNTQASTVGAALQSAGIAVYPEDIVQPPADASLDSGADISIIRAALVQISAGGVTYFVRTHQKKIAAILAEAGRTLSPDDAVYADGQRLAAADLGSPRPVPHSIMIQPATPITIADGGSTKAITTTALTVGQALNEAGIEIYLADGVAPPLASPVTPDLTIAIDRSLPVTIEADGQTLHTRTRRASVAEVLADAGLALVGLDYTAPPLANPPPADGSPIRLVRVVEQIVTEHKPRPYDVQYQPLSDLEIDNTKLIQAGTYGVTASRVRVRYENGVAVSRAAEDQWIVVPPQPKVIGYGTQIVLRTLDTADGPIQYWRAVRMYATSYSASRAGTPRSAPWYGRTRSGKVLTVGMAAIDLQVMPLGTPLYVPGYGFATAEDTGGGVKGKWIDLGYDDWNYVSWHQYVMVYFLAPIPPADQIKWVLP